MQILDEERIKRVSRDCKIVVRGIQSGKEEEERDEKRGKGV